MRNFLIGLLALLATAQASAVTIVQSRTTFPSGRSPDAIMAPQSAANDSFEEVFSTGNSLQVYQSYREAGERNEDSTTGTDYSSVSRECDMRTAIDLSVDASTTISGATILCGYYLSVSVGTAAISLDDNTTAKLPIPVAWTVGYYPNLDLLFRTSLVVNPGDTSTGTLYLWTRPGDPGVTR